MAKSEEELLLEEINRIIGSMEDPAEKNREDDRRKKNLAQELDEANRAEENFPEPESWEQEDEPEEDMEFEPMPGDEEPEEAERPAKKKKFTWTTIALIAGILLLVYAIGNFIYLFWNYHKSNSLYDDLNNMFVKNLSDFVSGTEGVESGTENATEAVAGYVGPWYEMAEVDLEGLKSVNSDVVGWIYQENGSISYPIMYSGDDETYLHAAMDKSYAYAGSIFMEGQNNPDFQDSYTIIYGHNMRNLSMFGSLKYYHKSGYYEEHPYFQIFTEEGIYRYHIFAYDIVDCNDEQVYSVPYGDNEDFAAFLNKLYNRSEKDTGVEATSADKVIALSTCSTGDDRFVIFAVLEDVHLYSDTENGNAESTETGTEAVQD